MKNRVVANLILITVVILWIMNLCYEIIHGQNFYTQGIKFILEAALVGGIADWFAVTALFRKPLGFSWHTAIIPRNREKMIEAVVKTVENELLSEKSIREKIENISFAGYLINYFDKMNEKNEFISNWVQSAFLYLKKLDKNILVSDYEENLKNTLKKVELWKIAKRFIVWLLQNSKTDAGVNAVIHKVADVVGTRMDQKEVREKIYEFINHKINEEVSKKQGLKKFFTGLVIDIGKGIDAVNVSDAADSFHQKLLETIKKLENPEHPVWRQLKEHLTDISDKMDAQNPLAVAIERWKNQYIDKVFISELHHLIEIMLEVPDAVSSEKNEYDDLKNRENLSEQRRINILMIWLEEQLTRYVELLKSSDEAKRWLDGLIKEVLLKIIQTEHQLIGNMIRETLGAFSDEGLNHFIESKAGNELQWIRINGSVVGAAMGLLLFIFLELIYEPFMGMLIR